MMHKSDLSLFFYSLDFAPTAVQNIRGTQCRDGEKAVQGITGDVVEKEDGQESGEEKILIRTGGGR